MSASLAVQHVTAGHDRTVVLRDLSLAVNPGQTAVVIGPNGHGKTTLLMAICGLLKPMAGEIQVDGKRVDGVAAEQVADRGIVHIMQGDGLFADMTVEENLLMGAFLRSSWRERRATLKRVYSDLPVVEEKRAQKARTLSGGERRLVGLGRGMMRPARLMLIDEPSLGLAPVAIDAVYAAIGRLKAESGATILLVEENFTHIGAIADRVHILEAGAIVRSGSFADVSTDRTVVGTYLGAIVEPGGGA
ncbi:MAG TPA: ABC transporter ATP-binding protein [Gaiellales bacterium]|jgi:branched-chain amino acid transport system ATP-binding protein|nr:ABC transporter ATP-binding protein [Gaiellales bacterium]